MSKIVLNLCHIDDVTGQIENLEDEYDVFIVNVDEERYLVAFESHPNSFYTAVKKKLKKDVRNEI